MKLKLSKKNIKYSISYRELPNNLLIGEDMLYPINSFVY